MNVHNKIAAKQLDPTSLGIVLYSETLDVFWYYILNWEGHEGGAGLVEDRFNSAKVFGTRADAVAHMVQYNKRGEK